MFQSRMDRVKVYGRVTVWKKGFTLVETAVVMVIMAVLAAIAIPSAAYYIKTAEFRKNEANAKTAYLAAESVLTWYRTSGEWETFREEILKGTPNETFEGSDADTRNGRIYAVTLNSSRASSRSGSELQVKTLLKDCGYDEDFLSGAIAIEVDVETGRVYSAFYATRCESLSYTGTDADGVLNISAAEGNRSYDNRKDRLLGYYSTEDVANVVDLKPVSLKVTSINLVNSETLSLNWSSNSRHKNEDVSFCITFYNSRNNEELFSTRFHKAGLSEQGWTGSRGNETASLELERGGQSLGTWDFPLLYVYGAGGQNGRFSLVLDSMMSAALMESLEAGAVSPEHGTGITRLGARIPELSAPLDIYAVVVAEPRYQYEGMNEDFREYNESLPVKSNTENTLFASAEESLTENGDAGICAKISRFRHLSNIRYYDPEKTAEFILTGRNLDWTATGAGFYDWSTIQNSQNGLRKIAWRSAQEELLDFPSVPLLSGTHTLTGERKGALSFLQSDASLSNLRLGSESVPGDLLIRSLYPEADAEAHASRYLGLFCEVDGTVHHVTFLNPVVELTGEGETKGDGRPQELQDLDSLCGVGILCGRSQGRLSDTSVRVTDPENQTVTVFLADRETDEGDAGDSRPAGIGGLAGVIALRQEDGALGMLTDSALVSVERLSMEGTILAKLPDPEKVSEGPQGQRNVEETADGYFYGIGGVFGCAWIGKDVKILECENHAGVTGNLFTGGVGGRVNGDYENAGNESGYVHTSGLEDCSNDGLILCARTAARKEQDAELTGRYFGGILGYGSRVEILDSESASGRYAGYQYMKEGYDEKEREDTLLGQYVGGIIGYGNNCHLKGCGTKRGGYILGSDYVGGIAGGLSNNIRQVITGHDEISATVNAGYVIGNSYVGGIVGKNDGTEETAVLNCVNNGVVAGYGFCIGGIVGYNGKRGVLENCASYLSDYDHSIYDTVVTRWRTEGDCAGGLAGYNNGTIRFEKNEATVINSVTSIVTGRNFVGGIVGFNDTDGVIETAYDLIGGQIHASGTGAGGAVGLNASVQLLETSLTVSPVSVEGEYGVGGVIGANVTDLKEDTRAEKLRADNSLAGISGTAFTGGIIGFQRTCTEAQIPAAVLSEGQQPLPEGSRLFRYLLAKERTETRGEELLPGLDADNGFPTKVIESENPYTLIIANDRNTKDRLEDANNNIPIYSYAYAGGIVGCCERGSRLVMQNCRNDAELSRISSREGEGISLKAYLRREGAAQAADQIEGDPHVFMIGGMIGVNMENQIIDHCVNRGNMRGFCGLGGIVGFNAGGVFNCVLDSNFGNAELDYIGGIAGLNVRTGSKTVLYRDVMGTDWSCASGTIGKCTASAGRNLSGRSYAGGIVGCNLFGGVLEDNVGSASVTAAGDYAGGIAGGNAGTILAAADGGADRTVTGSYGIGIGGLVGYNRENGVLSVKGGDRVSGEVTAVGSGVRVSGREKAGGIAGINEGILQAEAAEDGQPLYLTAQAAEVRALWGLAGGIAGEAGGAGGRIVRARNRCGTVTANKGAAGGIVAVNGPGMELLDCQNLGSVNSDSGHAGGITAENQGKIRNCTVGSTEGNNRIPVTVKSSGSDEIGAFCAVNTGEIRIGSQSPLGEAVTLLGSAKKAGGITGVNQGSVLGTAGGAALECVPEFSLDRGGLTVGGAAGENSGNGIVSGITARGLKFLNFNQYQYLGGIAGRNLSVVTLGQDGWPAAESAGVKDCRFISGEMRENSSAAGNCYGGITGSNSGVVSDCEVSAFIMNAEGVYAAASTSSAREKEASSAHMGGVAGKNEEGAWITGCLISGSGSRFQVGSGMAGGITGYNKGIVRLSGDAAAKILMEETAGEEELDADSLRENAENLGFQADTGYVNWGSGGRLEDFTYNGNPGRTVSSGRDLVLIMSTNGNLGGITAYNAPEGVVERCATGNWYLNNKSNAIGVGTGGIIGMNESREDLSFLLNRAFVGRQLSSGASDRFAGGIIGNQNNTTAGGWKLWGCINYGTVYCMNCHYSGGILGQWTGTGGTVEKCYNYGNLQTTYNKGWKGAAAGITAQLYHAYENNEYNMISCGNYGNIYTRDGTRGTSCANDSAGILGNITAYREDNEEAGQNYRIRILDCVNGPGVEIYSASMASGIVGFFSCDTGPGYQTIKTSTGNITLRIERCRNYAAVLKGLGKKGENDLSGGILGERYGTRGSANTWLKNCYSVNRSSDYYSTYSDRNYPVIFYGNLSNQAEKSADYIHAEANYYISEGTGTKDAANSITNGFVVNRNTRISAVDSSLGRADTGRAYSVGIGGERYIARLEANNSLDTASLTLSRDDIYTGRNKAGTLLFWVPGTYGTGNASVAQNIVSRGSDFDDYVRFSYHKLEDSSNLIQDRTYEDQMKRPQSVSLTVEGDLVKIRVAPATGTDPFQYKAVLALEGVPVKNLEFYSEEYSVRLSAQEAALARSGELSVAVRACSMFDDVRDSDPTNEKGMTVQLLPAPETRIELVRSADGKNLTYRFWLDNAEAYGDFRPEDGGELPVWKIQINGTKAEIQPRWDAEAGRWKTESLYTDSEDLSSANLQQLLIQAVGTGGGTDILASEKVSVPVFLPKYTPSMALRQIGQEIYAVPEVKITGDNLTDLRITVTLTAAGTGSVTTPPIYRAELIGTWDDDKGGRQENVVLRSADMLASAGGSVSAVFQDLPEYMSWLYEKDGSLLPFVNDLQVRIWYAQPGLGKVQTHYSTEGVYAGLYHLTGGQPDIRELDEEKTVKTAAEDGSELVTAAWIMRDSPVLDSALFADYRTVLPSGNGKLLEWLPAPVLEETPLLAADTGADRNRMQYTFTWDKDGGAGNDYLISLTGLVTEDSGAVSEVSIVTDRRQTGNTLAVDAENWTYESVRLTVTRVGSEQDRRIGLTAAKEYAVKQRLPRPAQPVVSNPDTNELNYTVEWTPIVPETGCISYGIWIQPYETDGTLGTAQMVKAAGADTQNETGSYRTELSLEDYAGERILIYLSAQADPADAMYIESVAGVTYEMKVPERIALPNIRWSDTWTYDRDQPVTAESFRGEDGISSGSLGVTARPDTAPPGDSSYLLKACVFEEKEDAEAAKEMLKSDQNELLSTLPGWLAAYPAQTGSTFVPVSMTPFGPLEYQHTLHGLSAEYAGRWILFCARVSSGNGQIGSEWAVNEEVFRLPFVRLGAPELQSGSRESEISAENMLNPDLPVSEVWTAVSKTVSWNRVELADTYDMTLISKNGSASSVQEQRFRVEETQTGDGGAVQVWAAANDGTWESVTGSQTDAGARVFDLERCSMEVSGVYTSINGLNVPYTVKTGARLEAVWEEGDGFLYTLILPDLYRMMPEEGITITDEALQPTETVVVYSDVKENQDGRQSDAYVRSEESQVDF